MTIEDQNEQHEPMLQHESLIEQIEHMEPLAIGDQRLERKIGWIQGAMVNVSYIIGAGIFVGPALTLQLVGSGGMNLIIWLIGAFVAFSGTYTFMELGTMLPQVGYLEYCYREPKYLLAYLFTYWSLMNRSSGVASQGIVFGGYMNYAIFGATYKSHWTERGWALLSATILAVVNIASTKATMKMMGFLTVVKLTILLLIASIGLCVLINILPSEVDASLNLSFYGTTHNIGPYASALYYVMNSYSGWHNLNYILDEVKNPIKNLPKASAAAILSTASLYILSNIAYLIVLPLDEMKNSEFIVAAAFFTRALGQNFASTILPIFIGLSAFGCGAAINFSAGRVIMEVARQGLLPYGHIFGKVSPKIGSPVNAYLLQYILSILFIVGPPPGAVYQFIVAFAAYPVYVFYFLMALAVLILRRREPFNRRPIVSPLVCVYVFLAFTAYALVFVFIPVKNQYYPYWVPYISAILAMIACTVFWYYQIVIKKSPSKSYNESIRNQGHAAIEQEIFREYTSIPNTDEFLELPTDRGQTTVLKLPK
ncbi:amino acid/polyamine transporter I [Cokeromyces recurvatus]|uniref:amino acid/polyamine transporter I n=1 Tax=Cokeromyces recurvatus TaxID=90255 RepID=UPI0022210E92|nr:amino acid/polyamine transporter I [Cokeromyces recurvatus]KAI7907678.1 amino acid/polyamine transporter I [Cokeromyces recurvatus]